MKRPWTSEFRKLVEDPNFYIFDFDYNLYDNDLKPVFEKQFCDYFYFKEIGQETYERFKQRLKIKLNMLYPFYKEYYRTVKQVEIEDFMITKDLKETYTREVTGESNVNNTSQQTSKSDVTNNSVSMFSDTPKSSIDDVENYMTNATKDKSDNIGSSTGESVDIGNQNNKSLEKTEFHSVGDLGVSSSGLLIQGWRDVITNINQLMFDEMEDLFFELYDTID